MHYLIYTHVHTLLYLHMNTILLIIYTCPGITWMLCLSLSRLVSHTYHDPISTVFSTQFP